jgi:hypothetical protein
MKKKNYRALSFPSHTPRKGQGSTKEVSDHLKPRRQPLPGIWYLDLGFPALQNCEK